MSEERLNGDIAAIEAALCSLTPSPSGIQRDRLMFLAGKAAARRRSANLLWSLATASSLMAAATFGILWATGNTTEIDQTCAVSVADLPAAFDLPADASPPSPWENRRLCQLVLEKGIDALPESSRGCTSIAPPVPREETYRSLLKQFLDNPAG